jgi:serine/threonine protein phosphatase 1
MTGTRIYAIGDVHGHLDKLRLAHARITEDAMRTGVAPVVVHIGDLTDRGPESRGVIDYLIDGIREGAPWVVIKGNHDRLFETYIRTGEATDGRLRAGLTWLSDTMGGSVTLASYGVEKRRLEKATRLHARAKKAVPEAHVEFIASLPLWYRAEGMIFVHAGIRPGFPLEAQDEDDLLWIRDEFLWQLGDHEALIVHGHTPVDAPTHYGNRVNIDTGAGWGNELVPVVFEGGACFALTAEGREPVLPPGGQPQ